MIKVERARKIDSVSILALDNSELNKTIDDLDVRNAENSWYYWIDQSIVLIAKTDSCIVGAALAFAINDDQYCLHKVITHPQWRHKHIASRLIGSIINETEKLGAHVFTDLNPAECPAITLFDHAGFFRVKTGAIRRLLDSTLRDSRGYGERSHLHTNSYSVRTYQQSAVAVY